ncbi:aminoglycoside phosphotransferase family protein [Rhodovulum sp. DZ06]|uniref:aminoglycoside phosphotransferase family protein n=1 Tax=Rhodovulum sp. DZ06 TaxID=3425126 RepID=UPI003D326136
MTLSPADRLAARDALLEAHGWAPEQAAPLAGDASARKYLRLSDGARRAVLMDADPGAGEDVRPYIASTAALRARLLNAPEVLAADEGAGFLLVEDLGDALFARVCAADPAAETPLYAAAVDALAHLHESGAPTPEDRATFAPYDMSVLLREARLAVDWRLPALSTDLAAEYEALCRAAFAPAAEGEDQLVLRDYHAENLIWLPERTGHARVGLIDHQDMLVGRPAYDLVSLLEDARRDTSAALRDAMTDRYCAARGMDAAAREAFGTQCALLAAQRNLKIVGIFARLCLRDGKPKYVDLIPRVWGHLGRDLSHPALADLRAFVMRHLPPPDAEAREALKARAGTGVPA